MSFWLKFLRDANFIETNERLTELSLLLSKNFANIEQLINSDENQLKQLGFVNQTDRIRLMEHARRLNQSISFKRRSTSKTNIRSTFEHFFSFSSNTSDRIVVR